MVGEYDKMSSPAAVCRAVGDKPDNRSSHCGIVLLEVRVGVVGEVGTRCLWMDSNKDRTDLVFCLQFDCSPT